jgi:hypothetical protein
MNAEEVITKITEQIVILNRQPLEDFSGDTLSRVAVKLASYKAGLGSYSSEAKKASWVAEKNFREKKANEFKRLRDSGSSATDANELKLIYAGNEYNAFIEAQELEDKITTLSFNVHDLIDAIKSRVINVQMEARESQVY